MTVRRSQILVATLCVVFLSVFGHAASNEFEDVFKAGLDAEAAGNLDEAIRYFTEAVKIEPASATTWAKRGELYLKKSDMKAAMPGKE